MRTLKKTLAAIVRSIRFISIAAALIAVTTSAQHNRDWKVERSGLIKWSTHCDFPGGSTISHIKVTEQACSSTCLSNSKCTHFSFNGHLCFLKRFEEHVLSVDKATMTRCGFITNREVSSSDESLDQILKNDAGQTQMQHDPATAVQKSAINPRQGTIANGHPSFNSLNTVHQTNDAKNASTFPEKPTAVVHQQNTKSLPQGAKANNGQQSSFSLNNMLQGNMKNEATSFDQLLKDDVQTEQQLQQRTVGGLPKPNTVDHDSINKKNPAVSQASKPVMNSRAQQSDNGHPAPSISRALNQQDNDAIDTFMKDLRDDQEPNLQQPMNSDEDLSSSRLNSDSFPFGNQGPPMNRPSLNEELNEQVNRGTTHDDDMPDDEMPENIQQQMNGDDDFLNIRRDYFTAKTTRPTKAPTTTKRTTRATKPTTPSPYKPGELMWSDEFKSLDTDIWKQTVTGKNGDKTFQFYSSDSNNSFIRDGILFIKPTLTVDRLDGDEDQLSNGGMINLISEGCDKATDLGQCVLSSQGLSNNEMINPIVSAQLSTEKSFNFTFGRVEIRAKMPAGDWISSGISLLPAEPYYGEGPRSGEIDIISSHGNQHMTCNSHPFGRQMASSSIHVGSSAMNFDSPLISIKLNRTVDYSADFHLYRLDWSPDGFKIFIDGQLTGEVKAPANRLGKSVANQEEDPEKNPWLDASLMAPFDQPFYFVLDVNVGGSGFPDDCDYYPHKKPWTANDADAMRQFWDKKNQWLPTWNISKDDNAMQVDYIRIYAL